MMHGDWKRYVPQRGPSAERDLAWRITSSILDGTWDNQFSIEPDGEMIRTYVPPEARPIQRPDSVAEALGTLDQWLRNRKIYSTFPDLTPEIAMANMLSTLRKLNKQQQLGDEDRHLLEKIERTFAFQSRREAAMAMLLWELRKEYEQRYCTLLSPATEAQMPGAERKRFETIIDRIDNTLAMNGA